MSWHGLLWWESRHIRCLLLTYKESFFNLFNKTIVNFPCWLCWICGCRNLWILYFCFSVTDLCQTLCKSMYCSMPGFPVLHYLPELAQIHVYWVWCHQWSFPLSCYPLLLLPSIFPSIRVFSNESAVCIRWPKFWSFGFSISPSNDYSGLISFRIDWFDLLAVQGTLKSPFQHHSSKVSILQFSVYFMVQLSNPYTTIGKTIALTLRIFVGKVMSLLFYMLFRFVIAFLPWSKCLLISWLQSPSAVLLEPPK